MLSTPRSRGVSTIELLVAATLSLFTVATLFSFFRAQGRAMATQQAYTESQSVTRTVVDVFARELRMASYDPTGGALPANVGVACPGFRQSFLEATPTRIRFRKDLDGNGSTGGSAEDVIYELVGDEIQRRDVNLGPDAVALVGDVPEGGLRFRYFDGSHPPLELVPTGTPAALDQSQRNCIAKIRFTVRANLPNPDPYNAHPLWSVAKSEVAIRQRSLLNF